MVTELDASSPWQPLTVAELVEVMRGANFFWCLAGGYAIEHVLGRTYRQHGDIDIVVLRPQQLDVQKWFDGWLLYVADPRAGLHGWETNEILPRSAHDIWCHREESRAWELQIMVQESDGAAWQYRRDPSIRGSVRDLAKVVSDLPCLRMDLQLLYKSKEPRSKDEMDFRELLPILTDAERETLAYWLRLAYPNGHPWIRALA